MHEKRQEYVWIVIPPDKLKSKIQSDQFKYTYVVIGLLLKAWKSKLKKKKTN